MEFVCLQEVHSLGLANSLVEFIKEFDARITTAKHRAIRGGFAILVEKEEWWNLDGLARDDCGVARRAFTIGFRVGFSKCTEIDEQEIKEMEGQVRALKARL